MIQVFSTPELLADAVARNIAACAADAISSRGRFTLALAGGSTPRAAYSRLATRDSRLEIDWRLVHVVWGDERCVPPDDPRSNYRMAKEALLDRVPIPRDHIHRIRGEDDPETAAADYEREMRALLCHSERSEESLESHTPRRRDPSLTLRMTDDALRACPERSEGMTTGLDLVLLGLGEDGHTASLFPGQPSVHETARWVMAVPAPDGKLWRVTLTPPILNAARNVTFVVSGASKAARLQQVVEGKFTPDALPAQAIRPVQGRLAWMVDQMAGARLRGDAGTCHRFRRIL